MKSVSDPGFFSLLYSACFVAMVLTYMAEGGSCFLYFLKKGEKRQSWEESFSRDEIEVAHNIHTIIDAHTF